MITLFICLSAVLASCPSSVITSSTPFSRVDRGGGVYTPSVQIPANPVWATIPDAQYIWESSSESIGPFKFFASFSMAAWATQAISSIQLLIACDNAYSIEFNGVLIAPRWSGDWATVRSYELKPFLRGSDANFLDNELVIYALNFEGPAGLIYKLQIAYCWNTIRLGVELC